MAGPYRVLLICGSLRSNSTNAAVLRTAKHVAPPDVAATVYDGLATLPHFNPDDDVDPLPPAVAELRAAIRAADALCFSTPEYAGALPGSFKNLLDWTIGDDQPGSIYEKPVAWINASPRGATHAHESLRLVLGYAHAHVIARALERAVSRPSCVWPVPLAWLAASSTSTSARAVRLFDPDALGYKDKDAAYAAVLRRFRAEDLIA